MKKIIYILALPMFLLAACSSQQGSTSGGQSTVPQETSSEEESSSEPKKVTLEVKIKATNLKYNFKYDGVDEYTYWKIGDNYMEEYNNIGKSSKTSYYFKKDADGKFFVYQIKNKGISEITSAADWGAASATKVTEAYAAGNTTMFTLEQTHSYPESSTKANVSFKVDGATTNVETTEYTASTTGTKLYWVSNASYDLVGKHTYTLDQEVRTVQMVETDTRVSEFPTKYIPA